MRGKHDGEQSIKLSLIFTSSFYTFDAFVENDKTSILPFKFFLSNYRIIDNEIVIINCEIMINDKNNLYYTKVCHFLLTFKYDCYIFDLSLFSD